MCQNLYEVEGLLIFKSINRIVKLVRKLLFQKLHINLPVITVLLLLIFTVFIFKMVGKQQFGPTGWVRLGCDDYNTSFYPNAILSQTRYESWSKPETPKPLSQEKMNLKPFWDAEEISPEPFQLVGGVHKLNYNIRTCDLNSDGKLEIIVCAQGRTLILNSQGVFQYSIPYWFDVYVDEMRNIHTITCSLNIIRYSRNNQRKRNFRTKNLLVSAWLTRLYDFKNSNIEVIAVEKIITPTDSENFLVSCYELETGQARWSYNFDLLPFISAIGDINQDDRNEIICTTFCPDKTYGEVVALSSSGRLIWQFEFNPQTDLTNQNYKVAAYTDAAIADLDGDKNFEVVAIFGTEDGSLGRFGIVDGKTGKIIDQYPKHRYLRRSFTSLGIADLDYDGYLEIVTATRGKTSRLYSFRLGSMGLELLASKRYFPLTIRDPGKVSYRIWALSDIDNDNEIEILSSIVYEMPLSNDWAMRSSRFLEPSIIVLDGNLQEKDNIDLDERCLALIVSSLTNSESKNVLVLNNQLHLYGVQ
jgi:hypothetical protein